MASTKKTWQHGDRVRLANTVGISKQYLSDLLCRRKRALPELARSLSFHAALLGYSTTRNDWMYPAESKCTLFRRTTT